MRLTGKLVLQYLIGTNLCKGEKFYVALKGTKWGNYIFPLLEREQLVVLLVSIWLMEPINWMASVGNHPWISSRCDILFDYRNVAKFPPVYKEARFLVSSV